MNRIATLCLSALMCISLCACGGSNTEESSSASESTAAENTATESPMAEAEEPGSITSANAKITITDYARGLYLSGGVPLSDCLTVFCEYTNLSDYENSMFFSAEVQAFQNGIELDPPIGSFSMNIPDDVKSPSTNVLPGYSYTTYENFHLEDTTSPVTLRITAPTNSSNSTEITIDP